MPSNHFSNDQSLEGSQTDKNRANMVAQYSNNTSTRDIGQFNSNFEFMNKKESFEVVNKEFMSGSHLSLGNSLLHIPVNPN